MNWTARRNVLLFGVAAILALLVGRLFYMQVIRAGEYRRIATENRIRILPVNAPRGMVYDRNGEVLVNNRLSFGIAVLPSDFKGGESRTRLANVLQIDEPELQKRLSRRSGLPLEPVGVYRDADFRTICRLQERLDEFPGVIVGNESVREYPYFGWAGHALGYVREVSPEDEKKVDRSGAPLRGLIGAVGLEKQYDDLLRGVDGIRYVQVNALGQLVGPMPGFKDEPPIPGSDLMLNLDARLQLLADSLLGEHHAGTVVAMDLKTGGIICFVTRPGFDANSFSGVLSSEEWETLRTDPRHPLLNRALKGLYSPGSTAKLMVAAAALESGSATVRDRFTGCRGGYRFGNRVYKCWKPEGHGSLDMAGAIEQSCNVYFYQLVQKMSLKTWSTQMKAAGLGTSTGIDMPGEGSGLVPSDAYFDERYGKGKWSRGLLLNLGIGQGEFLVTPLQLVQFYGAIANNGTAMKPRLLRATRGVQEDWVYTQPEVAFRLPYSASTLMFLRDAARSVVAGPHGTARGIRDPDVRMAGKTGTAQNPHGKEHSWFAGYAPAEAPEIAIVALVENAGHGSEFAAPVCRWIAKDYLTRGKKTDQPIAASNADSSTTAHQ
ncbi:MAG: penicillin-binding protein 2 [Candidatus Zixiibacteriota bacterium]